MKADKRMNRAPYPLIRCAEGHRLPLLPDLGLRTRLASVAVNSQATSFTYDGDEAPLAIKIGLTLTVECAILLS
jgi:hypothetical protein